MEGEIHTEEIISSLQKLGISTNFPSGQSNNVYRYVYSLLSKKNNSEETQDSINKSKSLNKFPNTIDFGYHLKGDKFVSNTEPNVESNVLNQTTGPNMVIHVCDEAKNLKQDFSCPRDLLIHEMKYFADYLSVESQRLEEVDISVHCDIHIFDWLMRYVKRGTAETEEGNVPKLDPSNVISILISSDFLKMETLVEECISFCHKNMSAVIAAPCNMNCVNDKLTTLLASRFTHNELEEVKDRKDKFKSKLYCKKIEKLFEPNSSSPDSLGQACYLFKCMVCQRVMTMSQSKSIPCSSERTSIGSKGQLQHEHIPEASWDVNTFIVLLYEELHKWNLVYWRLWGIVNNLTCSRCANNFQLSEFGQCKYHSERAQYCTPTGSPTDTPLGCYSCCEQETLRFDPSGLLNGCSARDHIVTSTDSSHHQCLDDFLQHKAIIKTSKPTPESLSTLSIFSGEEQQCNISYSISPNLPIARSLIPSSRSVGVMRAKKISLRNKGGKLQSGSASEDETTENDDFIPEKKGYYSTVDAMLQYPSGYGNSASSINVTSVGDTAKNRKGKDKIKAPTDSTVFSRCSSKQKWDSSLSIRWNQDAQREDDTRRLRHLSLAVNKKRLSEKQERTRGSKDAKEIQGGIFRKLEVAFINSTRWQNTGSVQMPGTGRQHAPNNLKEIRGRLRYMGR